MATLLKALGLPTRGATAAPAPAAAPPVATTAGAGPAGDAPDAPDRYDVSRLPPVEGPGGKVIDLNLPRNYDPDAPAKKPIDTKLPSDPKERVDFLADLVVKVQDSVKRD